jgi:nucleoporin NUP1
MHDDERVNRLGRKSNVKRDVPVVNGTKPYAGEGGMKKLLARRRMEAEKHGEEPFGSGGAEEELQARSVDGHASHAGSTLSDGSDDLHMGVHSIRPSSHPLPASKDWYSPSAASSMPTPASVSSLRVGRIKTRAHIARPIARPMKTKFSAAYEDDDSMDGTEVLRDESEKQLEREMLDEAAKRAPAFKIPETFSFAKEVRFNYFLLFEELMPIRQIPWNVIQLTRKNLL